MNDYILRNLGYSDHPIGGDLMFTETFCNLTSKRDKTLELYFEAYGVQRILPICEHLISMYQYQKPETPLDRFSVEYGMLISVGFKFCLVIPIIGGKADFTHSRRINVGTSDCLNLMSKNLILKFEHLSLKMNFATLKVIYSKQTIFDKFAFCAKDYNIQLAYYQSGLSAFEHKSYQHPLILTHDSAILENLTSLENKLSVRPPILLEFYETELEKKFIEEEKDRKLKLRQEQAVRFREAMQIKIEGKKNQQREELSKLEAVLSLRDTQPEQFQIELKSLDLDTPKELERTIKKLKVKLGIISKSDLVEKS
jgi:actin-related protein 5